MRPLVHLGPILATLRRHRTAATLMVLEIALTCAILCNALFLIGERMSRMQRPSGIAERELVRIGVTGVGKEADARARIQEDLALLSTIPGVRKAASTYWLPFGGSLRIGGIKLAPDQVDVNMGAVRYPGSEGLIETLGVQLLAGRDFTRDEYVDEAVMGKTEGGPVIVSRAVAERLWPGRDALGQTLYMDTRYMKSHPLRVVGVIERLVSPGEQYGGEQYDLSVLVAVREGNPGTYVLRVDSARRAEVLAAAVQALQQSRRDRLVLEQQTIEEMRAEYYRSDQAMAWLLGGVCAAMLLVTALGIVGLASFWVQQRTKQIGIRRALGATRGQIQRYFQTENFLLATLGIVLGMVLAYAINLFLMERYALARLPVQFLPVGAITLWLLGQVAVLGPARRAASVPPAVATRTV
jgi:putative ABC transport system permease protein